MEDFSFHGLVMPSGTTVCETYDLEEARTWLSSIYCPYTCEILAAPAPSLVSVQRAQGNGVDISRFSYGADVKVIPENFDDFVLVTSTLAGNARIEAGRDTILSPRGTTAVLNPEDSVKLAFDVFNVQFTARLELSFLNRVCFDLFGEFISGNYDFSLEMGSSAASDQWCGLMAFYTRLLDSKTPEVIRKFHLRRVEEMLATVLIMDHEWSKRSLILANSMGPTPLHVRRAIEFIEQMACADLTLGDIANEAKTSIRSLQRGFERFHSTTPMRYLQKVRMKNARNALLQASPDESVTTIAMRCGFFHLGQFASDYRKTFGELPSQSLGRLN